MDAESYTPDLTTVEGCAEEIANWVYTDSRLNPRRTVKTILFGLKEDVAAGSPLPTKEECELLVTGGDDGEIPRELQDRYPSTNRALNEFY